LLLPTRSWIILFLLVFAAGALITAHRVTPYIDEAMLFSPARNLIVQGNMGTSIIDLTSELREGMSLRGIDHYTYQIMPFAFIAQAAWYRLAGMGLFQLRTLSTLFGILGLLAWYVIFARLGGNRAAAILALGFIATDSVFVLAGAFGRNDMIAASLAAAGVASYVQWRETRFLRAVFVSQCFLAASIFTHPAGMLGLSAAAILAVSLDWKRIGIKPVLLAAIPYLVAAGAWGLYILQAPDVFAEQMRTNAANRFSGFSAPLQALLLEIQMRYLTEFGFRAGDGTVAHLKAILLLLYFAAPIAVLLTPSLRARRTIRALLWMVVADFVIFGIIEGTKQGFYLVHVLPLLEGLLALWIVEVWNSRPVLRPVAAVVAVLFMTMNILHTAGIWRKDRLHTEYEEAIAFLKQSTTPRQLTVGSCELAFGLGFDANLVDDHRLGYFSHKAPDVIVVNDRYRELFERMKVYKPEVSVYVEDLLRRHFTKRYDHNNWQIYFRTS
jgi:4-amino-4-deoxy-L-arabinose transferase-like glycosyltransferase